MRISVRRELLVVLWTALAVPGCYGKATLIEENPGPPLAGDPRPAGEPDVDPDDSGNPGDPGDPGGDPAGDASCTPCGAQCCQPDEECAAGHCIPQCEHDRCSDTLTCCPTEAPVCVFGRYCRTACPEGPACGPTGELCCAADQVCSEAGACVAACAEAETLCGDGTAGSYGSLCCPAGDLCLFDECRTLGAVCQSFVDCANGEYCEQALEPARCLPNSFPPELLACQHPANSLFDPEVDWHWLGTRIDGTDCTDYESLECFRNVMVTPVVADLDLVQDPAFGWRSPTSGRWTTFAAGRHPEVVFKAYPLERTANQVIVVLDGRTGITKKVIPNSGPHGHVAVGDLDGDAKLEIVHGRDPGLAAVDPFYAPGSGEMETAWTQAAGSLGRSFAGGAPTLTDLDGDGRAEVVMGGVVLDGRSGVVLADFGAANQGGGPDADFEQSWYIAAVADVDLDGRPEVLTGNKAIEVARTCDWVSCRADQHCEDHRCVDDNGVPSWSWRVDWSWHLPYIPSGNDSGTGFPGVANFVDNMLPPYDELDDPPEVVVVLDGRVAFLNGRDGTLMKGLDGQTDLFFTLFDWRGGAPNIADFDGDGRPEVGFAGRGCMVVVDVDCAVADADSRAARPPGCATDPAAITPCSRFLHPETSVEQIAEMRGILWMDATQDESSAATGTSVFDFQGDGRAEVLYNDECFLRVYDGGDGGLYIERPNSSRTGSEYPIVVDVDGDHNSEIVWVANNDQASAERDRCASPTGDAEMAYWRDHDLYRASRFCNQTSDPSSRPDDRWDICRRGSWGVWAFGDPRDEWVRTRPIWHQHAFHITEVSAAGRPLADWGAMEPSWIAFNSYRQNVQGDAPLNAPDLAVELLTASASRCPPVVRLVARVVNRGRAGAPAGVPVAFFYLDAAIPDVPFATVVLPRPLLPGQAIEAVVDHAIPAEGWLRYRAVVNPDAAADPSSPLWECDPQNNDATAEVGCQGISG